MVFGFNSEVKQSDTVYHVQSELRAAEHLLDTQIFVGGRCVGKHATHLPPGDGLSDDRIHDRLREQHRRVVAAIRAGELEKLLAELPVGPECLSLRPKEDGTGVVIRLRVDPAPGRVRARLEQNGNPPLYAEADSDQDGSVELTFAFNLLANAEAKLLVQHTTVEHSHLKRFRLYRQPIGETSA